jgi:hypothetical protein
MVFYCGCKAFNILLSRDRMVAKEVLRLVMKYATSPKVRKWMLKGAPPGAEDIAIPSSMLVLIDCSKVCADLEL